MKKYLFSQDLYRSHLHQTLIAILLLFLCLEGTVFSQVIWADETTEDQGFESLMDDLPYVPPVNEYSEMNQGNYSSASSGFSGATPSVPVTQAGSKPKSMWSLPFINKAKQTNTPHYQTQNQAAYYSQQGLQPSALTEGLDTSPSQTALPQPPRPKQQQKKKSKWSFGMKKSGGGNQKPLTEEQIVNVGPREMPASTDPIFRLPLPIDGVERRIEPGIYLVKQKILDEATRELWITKENKVIMSVLVRSQGSANPGTPVQNLKIKNQPPKLGTVEAKVADDQQSLRVVLKLLDARYVSDPIPTITDARKELRY